jgi:hypothetical protein
MCIATLWVASILVGCLIMIPLEICRLFKIDARGMYRDWHRFYLSANGVWLTDAVPPSYWSRI